MTQASHQTCRLHYVWHKYLDLQGLAHRSHVWGLLTFWMLLIWRVYRQTSGDYQTSMARHHIPSQSHTWSLSHPPRKGLRSFPRAPSRRPTTNPGSSYILGGPGGCTVAFGGHLKKPWHRLWPPYSPDLTCSSDCTGRLRLVECRLHVGLSIFTLDEA